MDPGPASAPNSGPKGPAQLRRDLCIFNESDFRPDQVCQLPDEHVTFSTMKQAGVYFVNLQASGVSAAELTRRGFDSARCYRELGMDALDLTDGFWARSLVAELGAEALRTEFARTAEEAATLAGTEGAEAIGFSLDAALELCAGHPDAAAAVLRAQPEPVAALGATSLERLLSTGLRAIALGELGLGIEQLGSVWELDPSRLRALGFRTGLA